MTTEEFSNEFDTALDSYKRLKNFDSQENLDSLEFNEYEKSVFLTKAQEELIISTYDGRNAEGQTFEGTEESRRSLSSLIKTYSTSTLLDGKIGLSPYSKFFSLPQDLWYITYEAVTLNDTSSCLNGLDIVVTPITQDSYYRISKNPFRNAGKRRALRLDISNNVVEIVSKYNISKYLENWTIDRLGLTDQAIIRISVYELLYTNTPNLVCINEAIELSKKYSDEKVSKMINGVLDKIYHEVEDKSE